MDIQRIAAFSTGATGGNPAGVVICDTLPDASVMQAIAADIGYSETLGARRSSILMQFLFESALVTMIGGCIGTGLGVVGCGVIDRLSPVGAELSSAAIVGAVVFSAIVGLAFGTWPASRAAALDPIQCLRFE